MVITIIVSAVELVKQVTYLQAKYMEEIMGKNDENHVQIVLNDGKRKVAII